MGWNDIPKPKPTPPGDWEDLCSVNFQNWLLRCPPCLMATINRNGGDYHVAVNNAVLGHFKSLDAAKAEAELVITNRIREMLPIYKTLVERLENRFAKNIIPIKPNDRA
jgi:hypothetical protein